MSDVQATFFATVVDEWVRAGVTDAVVSPGNRSSLLSVLLVEDGRIRVHPFVDERSGSFFALGMAKATGRPTIVWTTSGTAAVECHPAVVEAHHGRVPMILCTADRPPELHHSRDWQSIDQSRLFGDILRWQFDPGVASPEMRPVWRSIAARCVVEAVHGHAGAGPVHLDLPIREPWSLDIGELPPPRDHEKPWHDDVTVPSSPSEPFDVPARGLFVVGEGDIDGDLVLDTAARLGWPVLADARSRVWTRHDNVISGFDALVGVGSAVPVPETIVHIGSPLLSKAANKWLGESRAEQLTTQGGRWSGNSHLVHSHFSGRLDTLLESMRVAAVSGYRDWLYRWKQAASSVQRVLDERLGELSEPAIARRVTQVMQAGNLFAATSMPVRDVDSYGVARSDVEVFANRGASGMDGLVSTAAGIATANGPTVMLAGDLSFLYDVNALWNIDRSIDLCIVVVDNNGGGIFSNIEQLSRIDTDTFERVVATPHDLDIARMVEGFGLTCTELHSLDELPSALGGSGVRVVHATTDRETTARLRVRLRDEIRAGLQ